MKELNIHICWIIVCCPQSYVIIREIVRNYSYIWNIFLSVKVTCQLNTYTLKDLKNHTHHIGFEIKRKFSQIKIHAFFSFVICFIMHLNKWYSFLKTELMLTTALKLCSHFNFYLYLIDKCKPELFYYRKIIYPLMEIFNKFVCDFFYKMF